MGFESIAIVGRGCVLPGALSPQELWELVSEGRSALSPAPEHKWRLAKSHVVDPVRRPDRALSDIGGYVQGFKHVFDPAGFQLPETEVSALGPLFQWTFHAAREALREAGFEHTGQLRGGTILGNLSFPTSEHAAWAERIHWEANQARLPNATPWSIPKVHPAERFQSGLVARWTTRALGLNDAVSYSLDAACASSLYAIHAACRVLQERRADLMLAGAVCAADDLFLHIGFSALKALSPTGQSRPFHPEADGLIPGEGAAVVALMRLEDALREGRSILGVVRGVGLSNDGRTGGFLSPVSHGQVRAMQAAYRQSGLRPGDIQWIECHATGTTVGDGTEIESTSQVFSEVSEISIGSLKANVGHLITTAGAAGLLKVLSAFEAGQKPPTPNLDQLHPHLSNSPLRVVQSLEPWIQEGPRRAAISAFGFGGNNAHLLVEQWDAHRHHDETNQRTKTTSTAKAALAITGLAIQLGELSTPDAILQALATNHTSREATALRINIEGLRFPPRDLQSNLAQQNALLAQAMDISDDTLVPERTGVYIGMQCDSAITRYGLRWRLDSVDASPTWVRAAKEAASPALEASAVLGTMPNITANRINRQLDLRCASHSVSADELSGLRALELAFDALEQEEIDAALIGASDFCATQVHEEAMRQLHDAPEHTGGDGSVMLVVRRADDARAMDLPIWALLERDDSGTQASWGPSITGGSLTPQFGHAHAASGLLHLATGALLLHHRKDWDGRAWEHEGVRHGIVEVEGHDGDRSRWRLTEDPYTRVQTSATPQAKRTRTITVAAHPPACVFPARPDAQWLQPAPPLPRVTPVASARAPISTTTPHAEVPSVPTAEIVSRPKPITRPVSPMPSSAAAPEIWETIAKEQRRIADLHTTYLAQQQALHQQFMSTRANALQELAKRYPDLHNLPVAAAPKAPVTATPVSFAPPSPSPHPARLPSLPIPATPESVTPPPAPLTPIVRPATAASTATSPPTTSPSRGLKAATPPPAPTGRYFSREELEIHASGKISTLFGEAFRPQDPHAIQCRMPEPPLLLADRVTGIQAEPASMGRGSIWTETDVRSDAWYLENGRMPGGVMIESGQADLFLISYLGADLLNLGERRYRLLGCRLTYHRSPPAVGETLAYDIHIDGHANQGDVRLFFFHYDCHINGKPALTVRSGQAGFFTQAELDESAGILWTPEEQEILADAPCDAPTTEVARSFSKEAVQAFARGDLVQCFGRDFLSTASHVRTPKIPEGKRCFMEQIDVFNPHGGPWKRGYLKATTTITPDAWFFAGHFKNDPCMPGTLMFEGCLQAMAFYLCAMGYSLDRDGWRFEPIPDETYDLICRGQVTPTSKELTYELFIEEVHEGPIPKIYADLLCTVDGLGAFHARRMGLQMVPDVPLTSCPELIPRVKDNDVAELDGLRLNEHALMHSAWGWASHAFGPRYAIFDGIRRAARLPGPPYHMVSRVTHIEGEAWSRKAGAAVEITYDVPADAWYFDEGGSTRMPFALLMEAALQPCGWLATYVGSTLNSPIDLRFRNLDGEGEILGEVRPDGGALHTRAVLKRFSDSASMVILAFEVHTRQGERDVYRLNTVFGFFPDAAFENQAGLSHTPEERQLLDATPYISRPLPLAPISRKHATLASKRLQLLDRIAVIDPEGGSAKLGTLRGEAKVDANAWFFKAHFFQDPVQPGSLGVEAILQVLKFYAIERGLGQTLREPRFEPIATAHPHRWKYRGQVRPTNDNIAVTATVTQVIHEDDRVLIEADAAFWVDGKKIYEASIGTAIRENEDASTTETATPVLHADDNEMSWPLNSNAISQFWRTTLGHAPSNIIEDIERSVRMHFLDAITFEDEANFKALRHRNVLYVANHQTAIETLVFSILGGAYSGRPLITLAKAEHRHSWYGQLLQAMFAHPNTSLDELTAYFERDRPEQLSQVLNDVAQRMRTFGQSLLIHIEGTRANVANQPLGKISGTPIDFAMKHELPIIPVRFTGGLPPQATSTKLDFPYRLGKQHIHVGKAIQTDELSARSYKERQTLIRNAVSSLGPQHEHPHEGNPTLEAAVAARQAQNPQLSRPQAILQACLDTLPNPSTQTRTMLNSKHAETTEDAWEQGLAQALGLTHLPAGSPDHT